MILYFIIWWDLSTIRHPCSHPARFIYQVLWTHSYVKLITILLWLLCWDSSLWVIQRRLRDDKTAMLECTMEISQMLKPVTSIMLEFPLNTITRNTQNYLITWQPEDSWFPWDYTGMRRFAIPALKKKTRRKRNFLQWRLGSKMREKIQ